MNTQKKAQQDRGQSCPRVQEKVGAMTCKIAIIGCGRAGGHLAFHLKKKNLVPVGIWDTDEKKAENLSRLTGLPVLPPEKMGREADMLFLAVPDDLIVTSCASLAAQKVFQPGQKVFHMSGSQNSALLRQAAKAGARIASLHPLQSFTAEISAENPFEGILMTVEGMPDAVEAGLRLAEILGARGMSIEADAKTLYHAAAVVASNYLVGLMDFAFDLLAASGIKTENPMVFLAPLVEGTLSNLRKMGPEKALTGPIARGDLFTLASHLEAIRGKKPERSSLYRELGRATLAIAQKTGTLEAPRLLAMKELFDRSKN